MLIKIVYLSTVGYPSTVHSIIKKREKRDKFLNQPVVEGYKDFDILFVTIHQ